MYEFVPQQRWQGPGLSLTYDEEPDYDYDVYLFWHSSPTPYIVSADDVEELDALEIPVAFDWQFPEPASPVSPVRAVSVVLASYRVNSQPLEFPQPLSPSYSTTTDFAFPEYSAWQCGFAGYSRIFRSGFLCTSQRISQRFDGVWRTVRKRIQVISLNLKRKFSR
ncbi:unnamed protein product [Somion occarium]|uniref:Uncharacterized protein n=1 Tax=Somion occarium TaxID=3059160 RepID=A0ABP1D604_9APHY